jgi:hypothetical protein
MAGKSSAAVRAHNATQTMSSNPSRTLDRMITLLCNQIPAMLSSCVTLYAQAGPTASVVS